MRYTPKHAAPKQTTTARRTATAVAVGASTLGAGMIVNTTSAHAATVSVAPAAAPAAVTVKAASSGVKLSVDGVIGPKTTKATQRWVGVAQTGSLNLTTRKALQRKVGTTQDGIIGPKTVAALQKKIGISRDGARYLNARTVKGLQSYLNRTLKLTGAAPVASSSGGGSTSRGGERLNLARAAMWDRIAWCESGRRWGLVASNSTGTYYGGLMMTHDAWRIGGGLAFSYNANQSSREEQITVANNLYAQLGLKPWSCAWAA
ncbi:transglycosylase-like protein with SLT domain [Branchiibius hedensis]|uniref:Transglycosylase-like domain-containing protein n=1 Tax=Branchiibius hedensis TaxID=672460 RepID=A0A2Y8ZZP2_9MICO|nr:transglycosylase family protein [Branchiibius hedensis]PWJ26575.1 transglycosylase-like protein with SLT domain [Branchiibius hedensis]SSA35387.1 Transglycosylase-like domain-containing protein [Branchiibius hedensis]